MALCTKAGKNRLHTTLVTELLWCRNGFWLWRGCSKWWWLWLFKGFPEQVSSTTISLHWFYSNDNQGKGFFIQQSTALWHLEVLRSILDLVLQYFLLCSMKRCAEKANAGIEKYSNLSFETGHGETSVSSHIYWNSAFENNRVVLWIVYTKKLWKIV